MSARQETLVERYVLPPQEIETLSLRRVEALVPCLGELPVAEREIVTRIVYGAGDPGLAPLVRFHRLAVEEGLSALRGGSPVVADVRMVEVALDRARLGSLGCELMCAIDAPEVVHEARELGIPRAVVAIRSLAQRLTGSVVVVGNAPTALLSLLDLVDAGVVLPSLIIGMPVGFVAASESKEELAARDVPFITIEGTRGGSAVAAAAANALLRLATTGQGPR